METPKIHASCLCGGADRRLRERRISIVPMGSLDDDPGVRPDAHIFVGSRAAWDIITDALPRHEENAPITG